MSGSFVNPIYYNLQKATIQSEFSPFESDLDVTLLITGINLTSSIDVQMMFGTARLVDAVGLLEGTRNIAPLRGEERIIFEIADSKTINENGGLDASRIEETYRYVGFIYKIDKVVPKEINDALIYDIHFISYQSFKAGTYEIIRPFIDLKVSDIVDRLFKEYYENNDTTRFIPKEQRKKLILEETTGNIRCWIPKMRPEEAMTFLSKRAYSENSPSCLFRFFESSRGYHFVTDEELFRLGEKDEKRLFEFTYLDAIPKTLEYFDQQLNNLETIENTRRINSLDDILNGTYRNKVIEIDILSRRLNLLDSGSNQYDYFANRSKYFRLERSERLLEDRHSREFIENVHRGNEDIQKEWLIVQNYTDREVSVENSMQAETYYPEITSNRQAYGKHIESISLNATGPGRFDITAGDIVNLDVQKFQHVNDGESGTFEQNSHLSGRYIVRSVTHQMDKEQMYNIYTLIKKDWTKTESVPLFGGGR
jgi:hypothetical protein